MKIASRITTLALTSTIAFATLAMTGCKSDSPSEPDIPATPIDQPVKPVTPPDNTGPTPPDNTDPTLPDNINPISPGNPNPTPPDNTDPTPPEDTNPTPPDNANPTLPDDLSAYYDDAKGKTGYELKTALFHIIDHHTTRSYGDVWDLVNTADIDKYYENDGSILDVYSEKPSEADSVHFIKGYDNCGNYRREGDCYNREHSFPKSWFGGKVPPMVTDGHHLFATDGKVNSMRGNWPFGEVGTATYTSNNGSKLGRARSGLGYSGTVFEPIDEFKGDFARAYFYMATRYQPQIASWEGNTDNADAVLNGTDDQVFEPWVLNMLIRWHKNDPVSQKEKDRNEAVFEFQGNRNPYVDYPEFVEAIWRA